MASQSHSVIHVESSCCEVNRTDHNPQVIPLVSAYVAVMFGYVNALALAVFTGAVGLVTNTANISVYLKMGFSETTNISFFALSIFDLLVSASTVLAQITYNQPVSGMRLSSGVPISEIGIAACYVMYPCLGCSAWITAILSIERCLCIATPLKVRGTSCFGGECDFRNVCHKWISSTVFHYLKYYQ